jgi:hypothetical protein
MSSMIEERRRPLPSISTVYRPIEEYWEAGRTDGRPDAATETLDPLDAFLVHRLLDLIAVRPVLIDAAIARTGGASTLIGLLHPRVRGVWAAVDPESLQGQRALSSLRDRIDGQEPGPPPLKVIARSALHACLSDRPGAVILVDARDGDPWSLAEDIGRWLDARPDALVMALGLGRVGDCPAIASLLSFSGPGSDKQFRLLRELSEVLMGSRLGLVAPRAHRDVATILERLEQYYTGNYRYLDLLWRANRAALREAKLDEDILRGHSTFGPISQEIEELKRAVREAEERVAARRLATTGGASSSLVTLRRALSPTPIGQAWRMAKRTRTRLSPTLIGRAYRFTKKVAFKCASLGC